MLWIHIFLLSAYRAGQGSGELLSIQRGRNKMSTIALCRTLLVAKLCLFILAISNCALAQFPAGAVGVLPQQGMVTSQSVFVYPATVTDQHITAAVNSAIASCNQSSATSVATNIQAAKADLANDVNKMSDSLKDALKAQIKDELKAEILQELNEEIKAGKLKIVTEPTQNQKVSNKK